MKNIAAVVTVLGLLALSTSAFAACGSNASRNSNTARNPNGGSFPTRTGTTDTAAPAGMPR